MGTAWAVMRGIQEVLQTGVRMDGWIGRYRTVVWSWAWVGQADTFVHERVTNICTRVIMLVFLSNIADKMYLLCLDMRAHTYILMVRQGGVISPILFSMYRDVLIKHLEFTKFGCVINGVYFGCITYADDIVLLSTSMSAL